MIYLNGMRAHPVPPAKDVANAVVIAGFSLGALAVSAIELAIEGVLWLLQAVPLPVALALMLRIKGHPHPEFGLYLCNPPGGPVRWYLGIGNVSFVPRRVRWRRGPFMYVYGSLPPNSLPNSGPETP